MQANRRFPPMSVWRSTAAAELGGRSDRRRAERHLDQDFRREMEDAYGADFSGVLVEHSARSAAVTAALGTVAATERDRVHVGPEFFRHPREFRERILAHELAHIVQKRRPATPKLRSALHPLFREAIEAEAMAASDCAIRRRAARVTLADAPGVLAPWGPAGHYYTSYFVMVAAGVEQKRAQLRAFFCQMPDQVFEFDAAAAGADYYWFGGLTGLETSTPPFEGVPGCRGAPNPDLHYKEYVVRHRGREGDVFERTIRGYEYDTRGQRLQVDREISEGLHSLTGGWANTETAFRTQMLRESKDDLEIGLALHPYGDSFAHRQLDDTTLMYEPMKGHGVEAMTGRAHEPDNVGLRFGATGLYVKYVASLYAVIRELPGCGTALLSPDDTQKALAALNNIKIKEETDGGDKEACRQLIEIAGKTARPVSLKGYAPESDGERTCYWCQFAPRHATKFAEIGHSDDVFRRVRQQGYDWYRKRHAIDAKLAEQEKKEREAEGARRAEQRRQEEFRRRWDKR